MTAGYAKRLESVSVKGLNGSGTIEFTGTAKHGAGKRYVSIELLPATLLELADALVCCPGSIDSPGHAVWHWENPARARPCPESRLRMTGENEDRAKKDLLAIGSAERGRILWFIEQKVAQVERDKDEGLTVKNSRRDFAIGLLKGVYDAISAGEHAKP